MQSDYWRHAIHLNPNKHDSVMRITMILILYQKGDPATLRSDRKCGWINNQWP